MEVAEVALEIPLRREGGTTGVTAVGAANLKVLGILPEKELQKT
jgi:hypothetical protein